MGIAETNQVESCRLVSKMSSQEVEIEVQGPVREDLIKTAVTFLTNPNVQRSPSSQKEAFLKKKGLTADEIRIAFERSSTETATLPIASQGHFVNPVYQQQVAPLSLFQKIRDVLNTVALFAGVSYAIYLFYKRFIAPFLFGKPKKPKSVESSISELNEVVTKSITELKTDVQQIHGDLEKVYIAQNDQQSCVRQISELKSEIATVKGILLSRHQFPSVSLSSTSIPAWQLTGSSHKDDKELENEDADVEHHSGSSEAEIVPNPNSNGGSQGSDSSLEMIKEVDS